MKNNITYVNGGNIKKLASNISIANGKTHKQGGIDIGVAEIEDKEILVDNIDGRTFVFSQNLGYAPIARKLAKRKGEIELATVVEDNNIKKLLSNNSIDNIKQNTNKRLIETKSINIENNINTIDNIDDDIKKLAIIQENEKLIKGIKPKFIDKQEMASGGAVLSGATSGAGTGAMIGSFVGGPMGTAIGAGAGALIGGIASWFSSNDAEEEARKQREANERLAKEQMAFQEQQNKLGRIEKEGNLKIFDVSTQEMQDRYQKQFVTNAIPVAKKKMADGGELTQEQKYKLELAAAQKAQNEKLAKFQQDLKWNPKKMMTFDTAEFQATDKGDVTLAKSADLDVTAAQNAILANKTATNQIIAANTSNAATARAAMMATGNQATQQQAQLLEDKSNKEAMFDMQTSQFNAQALNQNLLTNTQAQNQWNLTAMSMNQRSQEKMMDFEIEKNKILYGENGGILPKLKLGYGGIIDQYYSNKMGIGENYYGNKFASMNNYYNFMIQKSVNDDARFQETLSNLGSLGISYMLQNARLPGKHRINTNNITPSSNYNNFTAIENRQLDKIAPITTNFKKQYNKPLFQPYNI
jgi:uncharacterized protein YcfJ